MKKALVVLLILAVAGGVFAQVTFTGEIKTGVGILITDEENEDLSTMAVGMHSTDTDQAFRFDLNGAYTNADGTVGANVRIRGDARSQGGHNILSGDNDRNSLAGGQNVNATVQRAEGWLKAFDGMLTVKGGRMDSGGVFGSAGGIDTSWDIAAHIGMQAIVTPIPGLDITVAAHMPNYNYYLFDTPDRTGRYHFAFNYLMPNVFSFLGHLRVGNGWFYDSLDAMGAVKIFALAPSGITTCIVDFAFIDLSKRTAAKFTTIQIGEKVEYVAAPLTVGGRFLQQIRIFEDDAPDSYVPDLTFYVWVQYAMGQIVPRLDLGFNVGSAKFSKTTFGAGGAAIQQNYDFRKWDGIAKGQFTEDCSNLQIRPNVQFRFGGTSNANYIELGYAAFVDLSKDAKDIFGKSMAHNIYADYKVSF